MSVILESDETGSLTIPPDLLANAAPHVRYRLDSDGPVVRIAPCASPISENAGQQPAWIDEWLSLARQIGAASTTDQSAVDLLSGMRR